MSQYVKKALEVVPADTKRKIPGRKRDFLVILLPVKTRRRKKNIIASVVDIWEIEKTVFLS